MQVVRMKNTRMVCGKVRAALRCRGTVLLRRAARRELWLKQAYLSTPNWAGVKSGGIGRIFTGKQFARKRLMERVTFNNVDSLKRKVL
jgi:hypothetical protein